MPRIKKNKLLSEIIDFFYSLPILIALWVYSETSNKLLTALSFIVSLGLLYFAISRYKQWRRRRLLRSGIDVVDNMTGTAFDEYALAHFQHLGYSGHLAARTEEHGADLILQKDGKRAVVQTKRWKSSVGADVIEQIIGAIKYYGADKGIVFTNSSFTESAKVLAESKGIELWDRTKLIELIGNV